MFLSGVFALFRNAVWVAAILAVFADASSTEKALASNPNAYEANPLMAPIVEAGYLWPTAILTAVLFLFLARPLWDYNPRRSITVLWVMFAAVAVFRFLVAAHNLQVAGI
jgi:hypothetical protein